MGNPAPINESPRPSEADELDLERYRGYLRVLATMHLDKPYQGKLDASDVVQQALLLAHRDRAMFRGKSDAELAGWLRSILSTTIGKATRDLRRAKRDVAREHSLQAALDASSARLENWLVADVTSPSGNFKRWEQVNRVADAMSRLSERHRTVLLLRHCQNLTLTEIGKLMDITPSTVVGLLDRASLKLREILDPEDNPQ